MPYLPTPYGYDSFDLRPLDEGDDGEPDWVSVLNQGGAPVAGPQNYDEWQPPVPTASSGPVPPTIVVKPYGSVGAVPSEWREYFDPDTQQWWATDDQGGFRYVRDANPWELPGTPGAQAKPAATGTAAKATSSTGASSTAGIYNRGPLEDLLKAMQLQYQLWRDKLQGRANEKQTALQYALAYGAQSGYVMDPAWFAQYVHDEETRAGIPPDPSEANTASGYKV